MRHGSLHTLVAAALAGVLAGCASSQTTDEPDAAGEPIAAGPNQRYEVTANHAPFYHFSPAQSAGPDQGLQKGEAVELIQKERGFSRVRTSAGKEGYIANDQLAPLPPEPALTLAPNPGIAPNPELPGRLQIVPLDQMLTPVEPPLPTTHPTPSPTF